MNILQKIDQHLEDEKHLKRQIDTWIKDQEFDDDSLDIPTMSIIDLRRIVKSQMLINSLAT